MATIALFLTARLWLRLPDDVDDFIRHRIDQKNLVFHFRVAVVRKLGNLLSQFGRKAVRLDAFRQCGADFRVEILGGLGRFESELNFRVLGQQGLTNPARRSGAAAAEMGSAARYCRRSVRPRRAYYRRQAPS